jgi:menaquinone-specific isochorismate synthase
VFKSSDICEFIYSGSIVSTPEKKILLGWGPRSRHASYDTQTPLTFYTPDFFLKEAKPWTTHSSVAEISIEELSEKLQPFHREFPKRQWINPFKEQFRTTLEEIHKKIYSGELDKAVPFVFEISNSKMSPEQLITSLMKALEFTRNYPIHLYGFWNEREGILGATPEILFSLDKTQQCWTLKTSAIAGTKDRQRQDISMEKDPKTYDEHALVISGIQESLKFYGQVELGELEEIKLPNLTHLKTPITVKMNQDPDLEDIIARLHPTPALGAYPRKPGLAWLKSYQTKIDRKHYGAPVGYIKPESQISNFYVAIRNIQWDTSQIQIGAGCGIVAGSNFNNEWQEIHLKIKSIKEIFAL